MRDCVKNPFAIRTSNQETFILRSAELNYTPFGLAKTRYFEVYSEHMKHLGCITCECSEETGHEIVGHTLDKVWEEAVDCVEERHFRAAVAHIITTYKTKRYI